MGSTRAFPLPWYVKTTVLPNARHWMGRVCEPTDQASAPVLNGLLFATYRFLLKIQLRSDNDDGPVPTLAQIFLAGAGCGLASTYVPSPCLTLHLPTLFGRLLTTPIELVKTQQQKQQQRLSSTHTRSRAVSPARTVAAHIFRTGGLRAIYRGLSATILRDVGGFGMYFYGVRASSSL